MPEDKTAENFCFEFKHKDSQVRDKVDWELCQSKYAVSPPTKGHRGPVTTPVPVFSCTVFKSFTKNDEFLLQQTKRNRLFIFLSY